MEKRYVYLFIDDIRIPKECYLWMNDLMFLEKDWTVVRSYNEFVAHIESNGLPKFISFDHDLADTHYTPEYLWNDYEASKAWQDSQVHTEKTGFDCALWLVNYCQDKNCQIPDFYCHSMNPVGRDKIISILSSYQKHFYEKH